VAGHGGNLLFGMLGGRKVVALQGRFHYYEGYAMQQVVFPVRVLKHLGITSLILSNAAGGVNPAFAVGDLMIIEDHINLMGANPLTGRNDDSLGPRFPDMREPYDREWIIRARRIADKLKIRCHTGVYAAVTGPCYETRAEYRYVHTLGADAVGMSTVPEAIAARHMGLKCFAVSVITDLGGQETAEEVSHEEVVKVASEAGERLTGLIIELIK
jgi:purine-nucleoside phosphorylase